MVATICVCLLLCAGAGVVSGAPHDDADDPDGEFEAEITNTTAPVAPGGVLVVTVSITNTGAVLDSQQVHLKRNGSEILDSVAGPPVTLAPGERTTRFLTWQPPAAVNDANLSVQTDDVVKRKSVERRSEPHFDVSIERSTAPVPAGEPLRVRATIRNTGPASAETLAWLSLNGSVTDATPLDLAPAQERTVTLDWETRRGDDGPWRLAVGADGTPVTETVTVETPADTAAETDGPTTGDVAGGSGSQSQSGDATTGDVAGANASQTESGTASATASAAQSAGQDEEQRPPLRGALQFGLLGLLSLSLMIAALVVARIARQ